MPMLRPLSHPWKPGQIYLGRDPLTGQAVGLPLNRQALTIAGQGAGKGTCQIIPNLFSWPHSVLVIDPSGEAAAATAKHRAETFGHQVVVFDPFNELPDLAPLRGAINPLDLADSPDDFTALAASLVPFLDVKDPHWNDSARALCAGLLAYVKAAPDISEGHCFIPLIRHLIAALHDNAKPNKDTPSRREILLDKIAASGDYAAHKTARLRAATNEVSGVLSSLDTHTEWLDSPAVAASLTQSSVNLADMKHGKLSIYLVVPPDKLDQYGRYLRLLVRFALSTMWKRIDGNHKGKPCLFLLDEFAALGRMDDLRSALPQGRKYGLHIWPFVQNFGQLEAAYGKDKAQEFLSSTDFVSYFGIDDPQSLEHVSNRYGRFDEKELIAARIAGTRKIQDALTSSPDDPWPVEKAKAETQAKMDAMRGPRLNPEQVQAMLSPPKIGAIAKRMLVFTPQGWLILQPGAYFRPRSIVQGVAFVGVMTFGTAVIWFAATAAFFIAQFITQKHLGISWPLPNQYMALLAMLVVAGIATAAHYASILGIIKHPPHLKGPLLATPEIWSQTRTFLRNVPRLLSWLRSTWQTKRAW